MKGGFSRIYLLTATMLLGIVFLGFLFRTDIGYAYFFGNPRDTFMDYFNSISMATLVTSYKDYNNYPPLCWFFFDICRLLSGDTKALIESGDGSVAIIKQYQTPMMIWMIILMVCILLIYSLLSEMWDYEKPLKQWAVLLLMLSVPFLYAVERGNIIILSFIGTLAFFVMKDSEKRWVRDIGYLCLAFAAAIKIYPAIFGFVLIKEKKYKEALRLLVYGVIVFVVPFLFFCEEGIRGIPLFFEKLLGWSASYVNAVVNRTAAENGMVKEVKEAMHSCVDLILNQAANQAAVGSGTVEEVKEVMDSCINLIADQAAVGNGAVEEVKEIMEDGSRIGFAAFMEHFFMWFGVPLGKATVIASKFGAVLSVIAFVFAFLSKKKWQTILLFSCVMVGFQSRSYVYAATFMIIPFVFFMREEKRSVWNVIYFSLLMLILFPLPLGWTDHLHEWGYYIWHRSFNDLQIGGAILGITVVSLIDIIVMQLLPGPLGCIDFSSEVC